MSQEARERSMAAFKAGKKDVLIATDVAARGIDVDDVTHVINHTIPDDEKTYLHRAGRTGRAGKTGIAVTFVDWDDLHKWALINRALEFGQPEPVETYSSSPHLFTDLDIPAGTKGRIVTAPKTQAVRVQPERAADAAAEVETNGAGARAPASPAPRRRRRARRLDVRARRRRRFGPVGARHAVHGRRPLDRGRRHARRRRQGAPRRQARARAGAGVAVAAAAAGRPPAGGATVGA